jgi:glycerophosphoryl diester phosphodiesterase
MFAKYYFRILLLIFVVSCNKNESFDTIQLFSHAGNGLHISNSVYHDNSENSIKLALSQNGCDGVEVDVQLSKDGTAWLFHDENLKIEANLNACINSSTDEEISHLSYNHFNDEKLLKLKDLKLNSKSIVLDIRHANACENKVVELKKMLNQLELFCENNFESEIYLNTNNLYWISYLKSLSVDNSKIQICYSPSENEDLDIISGNFEIDAFLFKNNEITKEKVESIQNKGQKALIFEVRSPKGIRSALKKNPNVIITDDLKAAIIEKY